MTLKKVKADEKLGALVKVISKSKRNIFAVLNDEKRSCFNLCVCAKIKRSS